MIRTSSHRDRCGRLIFSTSSRRSFQPRPIPDQSGTVLPTEATVYLATVGPSARDCPYIARWIAFYRTRSSRHVEAALHRYAPESTRARSADEYIPVVARRVQRAASVWAATG